MSGSIVKLNASNHQTTQELLPWFVLGTLDQAETALVQEHLRHCAQCQADLELQRKVQGLELPLRNKLDVDSALAKLRPQLLPQPRPQAHIGTDLRGAFGERWQAWREHARRLWMPWALGLQTAALATLCIVVWHGQVKNDEKNDEINVFHVLGADLQGGNNIVVMFKPQTSEQELRRILQTSNTRLAGGPTVAGAYLLNVGDAQRADALAVLHREPAVVMAESLAGGERH